MLMNVVMINCISYNAIVNFSFGIRMQQYLLFSSPLGNECAWRIKPYSTIKIQLK